MENTQQTLFISTNDKQIKLLSKFLTSKNFEISAPQLIHVSSGTVVWALSTSNTSQKGLRAAAIQYVECNGLSDILMFDRDRKLKPIFLTKTAGFNR